MSFVTVYRVENGEGVGPYNCPYGQLTDEQCDKLSNMIWAHGDNKTHPSPTHDPKLMGILYTEYCAFESVEHMRDWFRGWGKTLTDCGFMVNAYSVPRESTRFGERQCLMRYPDTKPTHTFAASQVIS